MPALLTIVKGSTGPVYFQILDNGSAVDLSDFTVTLTLSGVDGAAVTTTGDVSVLNDANGVVSYTPDSGDLDSALSPYKARWVLTEDTGGVFYVPSAYRDQWDVVPV